MKLQKCYQDWRIVSPYCFFLTLVFVLCSCSNKNSTEETACSESGNGFFILSNLTPTATEGVFSVEITVFSDTTSYTVGHIGKTSSLSGLSFGERQTGVDRIVRNNYGVQVPISLSGVFYFGDLSIEPLDSNIPYRLIHQSMEEKITFQQGDCIPLISTIESDRNVRTVYLMVDAEAK